MKLRAASPADAAALADLHRVTIVDTYAAAYSADVLTAWTAGHTIDAWSTRLRGEVVFVIAEADGALLGCGGLDGNRTGVYVHPRAQRRGVGRAILQRLEAMARERGIAMLELSAPEAAVPFYASCGFELVASRAHAFRTGVELTTHDMTKLLV